MLEASLCNTFMAYQTKVEATVLLKSFRTIYNPLELANIHLSTWNKK
jgi:hypothetical protein